jgi:sigma-B regulation protein RsbU (phosphoserine phosphatase)
MPLAPGDRLLMWTDGVSEALDVDGRPFGRSRVERVIADTIGGSAGLVEALTDAVRRHAGGTPQDDVTVVAVTVSGR